MQPLSLLQGLGGKLDGAAAPEGQFLGSEMRQVGLEMGPEEPQPVCIWGWGTLGQISDREMEGMDCYLPHDR